MTNNGVIGDQNVARTSLESGTGTIVDGSVSVINFFDNDAAAQGHFFYEERPYLSGRDRFDLAALYQGTIEIPVEDTYTFIVRSDDGFALAFDDGLSPFIAAQNANLELYNNNPSGAMQFLGARAGTDSIGSIRLTAGMHTVTLTYHQGGGGGGVEFSAAAGAKTGYDTDFRLVGMPSFDPYLNTTTPWDYVEIHEAPSLTEVIGKYETVLAGGTVNGVTRASVPTVNFFDPEVAHNPRGDGVPFPGDTVGIDDDNFGGGGRITLRIDASNAGRYTFLTSTDDANRFRTRRKRGPRADSFIQYRRRRHQWGLDERCVQQRSRLLQRHFRRLGLEHPG